MCVPALSGFAPIVTAQTPYLQAHFHEERQVRSEARPTDPIGSNYDEFRAVAHNFKRISSG
jgi:hypothetical protein